MLRCQQPLFVHGSGAWVGHFRSSATKTVTSTAITERRRHDAGESRQKRKAPDDVSARQHRGFPHCLTHGDFPTLMVVQERRVMGYPPPGPRESIDRRAAVLTFTFPGHK